METHGNRIPWVEQWNSLLNLPWATNIGVHIELTSAANEKINNSILNKFSTKNVEKLDIKKK